MAKFDAQEFLQLGLRLVSFEPNEAGYRTAINRVYYACHLIGRESTAIKGWFNPKNDSNDHSGVWRALKEHTSWGDKLRVLYELREHADYHIDPNQQPTGSSCSYCKSKIEDTWARAKNIAEDILPRIQSVAP